jgi:hypothetical protein
VRSDEIANPIIVTLPVLYDLDTENHRVICIDDTGNNIVYTDFSEIDYNHHIESYEPNELNRVK